MLSFPWPFSLSNNSFLSIFLARSISFRFSLELYPLSKRNLSKSLQRLSKELVSEQMRFNLKAWLYGIPFLQWKGWHELDCKYWWLSVGLTYKSVSMITYDIPFELRFLILYRKLAQVGLKSSTSCLLFTRSNHWAIKPIK